VPRDFRDLNKRRTTMIDDLQKIAKRIIRMIEAGETGQEIFARDAGTLAELIMNSLRVSCLKLVEVFAMQHNIIRFCFLSSKFSQIC